MISFLQVENLSKRFGEHLLFENISFGIGKNQKTALIARNGKGKSTLLSIIAGKDTPDTGTVIFRDYLKQSGACVRRQLYPYCGSSFGGGGSRLRIQPCDR